MFLFTWRPHVNHRPLFSCWETTLLEAIFPDPRSTSGTSTMGSKLQGFWHPELKVKPSFYKSWTALCIETPLIGIFTQIHLCVIVCVIIYIYTYIYIHYMIPYIIAYTVVMYICIYIYIYSDYAHHLNLLTHECNTSLEPQVRTSWMCTPVNGS